MNGRGAAHRAVTASRYLCTTTIPWPLYVSIQCGCTHSIGKPRLQLSLLPESPVIDTDPLQLAQLRSMDTETSPRLPGPPWILATGSAGLPAEGDVVRQQRGNQWRPPSGLSHALNHQ